VTHVVHGGRGNRNRGGGGLLAGADRRSMAWTKCKAEGSFFSRASGEGNAGLREGEREVTAQGGRVTGCARMRSKAQRQQHSGSGLAWRRCGGRLSVRHWHR
jgi:hypothetical protein